MSGTTQQTTSTNAARRRASPLLIAVLTLPLLSVVLTAGVLACALLAWKRGYWGVFGRLHYSLVALSALTFVVLLAYYNLLGFRF